MVMSQPVDFEPAFGNWASVLFLQPCSLSIRSLSGTYQWDQDWAAQSIHWRLPVCSHEMAPPCEHWTEYHAGEKKERVGNRINRNTGKLQRKGQKPVSSFRFQSEEHNLSIYIFMMRDNNKNQYILMHWIPLWYSCTKVKASYMLHMKIQ